MSNNNRKVIFVHGLGQTPSSWNKTVSLLSKNISPVCMTLFSTNTETDTTYENLYHRFEEYCKQEEKPLTLCGISLGAILLLNYAINNPKAVQSLVLIAPQYKMPRLLMKMQNMLFLFLPKQYFHDLGFTKKSLIRFTKSMMDLNFEYTASGISCSTLVVCGEKDTANKKAAISLKGKIPLSSLCLVKNAGHEVNVEAPNQLADILNDFYSYMDTII